MTVMSPAAGTREKRDPTPVTETPSADARFYVIMAAVSALLIFAGFAPSFYLKPVIHAPPPLSMLTVVHGVVFTAWMILFVTQASLIATGRAALHRQLGMMGALLFGAMITLGFATAITAGRLGHVPPGAPAPLAFMALPLISFAVTGALVAAALWNRRRSAWHKRLMLAALFSMTGPGTGRLAIPLGFAEQGVWIAVVVSELLLAAAIAYDYMTHKRVHPAYWWSAGAFSFIHISLLWAFSSPDWLAFARAITGG